MFSSGQVACHPKVACRNTDSRFQRSSVDTVSEEAVAADADVTSKAPVQILKVQM